MARSERASWTSSGAFSTYDLDSLLQDDSICSSRTSCAISNFPLPPQSTGPERKLSLAESVYQQLGARDYLTVRDCPLTVVPTGERIPRAKDLWADAPALVYVVRRAGCPLCRAQALTIAAAGPFLRRLGYNLFAVVNDANDGDLRGFYRRHWSGRVLLDEELSFHMAAGKGLIRIGRKSEPFSLGFAKRIGRAMIRQRVLGTAKAGRGPYMGGVMLILKGDEGIAYTQVEDTLGDYGDFAHVLRAAYACSPQRRHIPAQDLEDELEAHRKRIKRPLPKECGTLDMGGLC